MKVMKVGKGGKKISASIIMIANILNMLLLLSFGWKHRLFPSFTELITIIILIVMTMIVLMGWTMRIMNIRESRKTEKA